ncbi:MAG: PEP/pyruvate-binding domain-containing protein, partial [Syntrophales bacterium]|nr:PEP/pyruvate-binding domain-containing protein [Syntrophales bacterium]
VENDYPRIVALDAPLVKAHSGMSDARRFSQHDVDMLNLEENRFQSMPLSQVLDEGLATHMELLGVRNEEASDRVHAIGHPSRDSWILTFDNLLSNTEFPVMMSRMLKTLESVYEYPVDIEFSGNFNMEEELQVNLLQCRPFQTKGQHVRVAIPNKIQDNRIFLRQEGNFMGGSVSQPIARIIYIDPQRYTELSLSEKYNVARLVGRLNKLIERRKEMPTFLLGPGRWGTTTPAMGVPVVFPEINNITAIAEIAYRDGSLTPDLSFGTHFFQDLVEMDIFYMAIYPNSDKVFFNRAWMDSLPNLLTDLSQRDSGYAEVVHVHDVKKRNLRLLSDVVTQQVVCFAQS